MQCRLPNTIPGRAVLAISAVTLSLAASGCDRTTTPGGAIAFVPATVVAGVVVITAAPIAFSSASSCANSGLLTPDLAVVVSSASTNLAVDHITLHLLDGTNIGGPGVTFPQADLNAQFVNTFVRAGASRTFVVSPTFTCGVSVPRSVQGEVGLVDTVGGGRSVMTATVALP